MKKTVCIQFRMPWHKTKIYFSNDLVGRISPLIKIEGNYAYLELEETNPIVSFVLNQHRVINGCSLIRLIRKTIIIEEEDITVNKTYVFLPGFGQEKEIPLQHFLSYYYNFEPQCEVCGRFKWIQRKNITLRKKVGFDIEEGIGGEVIIKEWLKKYLEENRFEGIAFRKISGESSVWQLCPTGQAFVNKDAWNIIKKSPCKICERPRVVALDESNRVSMFSLPHDKPRIENTPTLYLKKFCYDIALTDIEFGTVGCIPDGDTKLLASDITCRTSKPLWVVSGRLAKSLFQENVTGFALEPAEIY